MIKWENMSRKTREEKKIAAYRKKLQLLKQNTQTGNISVEQPKIKTSVNLDQNHSPSSEKNNFFIKDLKKSLLIIFLIITLEFIIYFATIKDYLKLVF